jgi:acetate kinase
LALNSGSSSFKWAYYQVAQGDRGESDRVEELLSQHLDVMPPDATLAKVLDVLKQAQVPSPDVIGHRIVHGGPTQRLHGLVDAAMLQALEAARGFAPLHMPVALAFIRAAQAHFPAATQVACFDTCFHANLPDVARVLPIPNYWQSQGIVRYGFHGLSLESILHQLGTDLPARVVVAHLGQGASVTAIHNGQSVDTSMGLTPSAGVIMGTRTGDIDPGVLLYLLREKQWTVAQLSDWVDHQSGLLGISGLSSDMQCLHAAAASNADAQLAIDMFCYSVGKHIAAMIAALDGIDLLVFTGGIGEHDALVRTQICRHLSWMGVRLDPLVEGASRCEVRVMPSREGEQIARHAFALSAPALAKARP